ncbi:MAG: YggT family protein [Polaromonas sp.]|jgi:YggT family protein
MLIRVLSFLLESFFFVLIAAALLRGWMNWTRVNMRAQPGIFVMAVTDWLVKPLRLMLPKALAQSKIDWASLLAALLFALVFGLIWLVLFTMVLGDLGLAALEPAMFLTLLGLAFKLLLRVALQTLMILVIGFAILSWVQPGSPAYSLLGRLTEPLLTPLRRVVPSVGGIDLSAIVLILALQIGLMVLA